MIYRNDSLFERFNVLFGKKSSIVAGEEYPIGYFAAEAFEVDDVLLAELEKLTQQAGEEFDSDRADRLERGNGDPEAGSGMGAHPAAPTV